MQRLRRDETIEEWVILAPGRSARVHRDAGPAREACPAFEPDCPFCPGNEDRTPPEIVRWPPGPTWQMRVVPNRYPALTPVGTTERHDVGALEMDAVGAHEVVIETRLHNERIEDMELDRVAALVRLWRDRTRDLAAQRWARAVAVFRNYGERAGTTLAHPHSQIIATPVTPPEILRRLEVAERYWEEHGRSIYTDMVARELDAGERIVAVRDDFVALAPFASRFPFETWILPREARASFTVLADGQIASMATVLRDVLRGLRDAAGDPDYNVAIRSAPVGDEERRSFVWHLAIFPRTATQAGFELGAAMAINTVLPEGAATALRASLATFAGR